MWVACGRVWKRQRWPEKWREEAMVSTVKKERREKVEEYRRVIIMPTLYKVYAAVLAKKLLLLETVVIELSEF